MQERDFYDERPETKTHLLTCPNCGKADEYQLSWVMRNKRRALPPHANSEDRARWAKLRSYMLRRDDVAVCKNVRCRKRFEIEGLQSVAFVQEVPNAPLDDRAARIKAAFGRRG